MNRSTRASRILRPDSGKGDGPLTVDLGAGGRMRWLLQDKPAVRHRLSLSYIERHRWPP